jgi:hypothetical protein
MMKSLQASVFAYGYALTGRLRLRPDKPTRQEELWGHPIVYKFLMLDTECMITDYCKISTDITPYRSSSIPTPEPVVSVFSFSQELLFCLI